MPRSIATQPLTGTVEVGLIALHRGRFLPASGCEERGHAARRLRGLVAPTARRLFPGVREDAHAPAKDEKPARQWRRKAQLAVNDRRATVDVNRHGLAAGPLQGLLDSCRRGQE